VGEDVDPHLPATLDVAGHRDTGGLDLAVGDPPGLERLDPVVAEGHARATLRDAGHPASMGLAVTDLAGHQHGSSVLVPMELRCLVVLALAGATLDLFLFGEETLELGVGLLDQRGGLLRHLVGRTLDRRGLTRRPATTATRADHPALRAL